MTGTHRTPAHALRLAQLPQALYFTLFVLLYRLSWRKYNGGLSAAVVMKFLQFVFAVSVMAWLLARWHYRFQDLSWPLKAAGIAIVGLCGLPMLGYDKALAFDKTFRRLPRVRQIGLAAGAIASFVLIWVFFVVATDAYHKALHVGYGQ